MIKPPFESKGAFGRDIQRLWRAIEQLRPQTSPGNRVNRTTRGTNIQGLGKKGGGRTNNTSAPVWL